MDIQDNPAQAWFDRPVTYQIVVKGRLDPSWAEWFDGLTLSTHEADGIVFTSLTGEIPDQGALHGLLARVRDLGLPLIEVHRVDTGGNSVSASGENKP